MEDDRSALNRYRRKLEQLRSIREDGGHREHEDTLRHEITDLWDQMTEDEKKSVRQEQARDRRERVPEPQIQEIPVEETRRPVSKRPATPKNRGPWNLN